MSRAADIAEGVGNAALNAAAGNLTGAAVQVISSLGQPAQGEQWSPDMKQLVAEAGAGPFEAYMMTKAPDLATGGTLEQILPYFYRWLKDSGKSVGWWTRDRNPRAGIAYIPGRTEQWYRDMGVDFDATVAEYEQGRAVWVPIRAGGNKFMDDYNTYTGFSGWWLLGLGAAIGILIWMASPRYEVKRTKKAAWA